MTYMRRQVMDEDSVLAYVSPHFPNIGNSRAVQFLVCILLVSMWYMYYVE